MWIQNCLPNPSHYGKYLIPLGIPTMSQPHIIYKVQFLLFLCTINTYILLSSPHKFYLSNYKMLCGKFYLMIAYEKICITSLSLAKDKSCFIVCSCIKNFTQRPLLSLLYLVSYSFL